MIRRWFFDVVKKSLPMEVQLEYAKAVKLYEKESFIEQFRQTFATLAYGYQVLAFDALNFRASIAEIVLVSFVLIAVGVGPAVFVIDIFVIGALILRDIWAHRTRSRKAEMPLGSRYCLDSIIDAVAAELALLFTQCVAIKYSMALAVPGGMLGPVAALLLPLIAVVRMALRPRPDGQTPGSWGGMSADEIYRYTWQLNVIWAVLFSLTVLMNSSDIRNYYPDLVRGWVAGGILAPWFALQRDALTARDYIQRLFRSKQTELKRKQATLPRGMKPGEPGYWMMLFMSALIVAVLVVSEGEVLWRWLSGVGQHVTWIVLIVSLMSFALTLATWPYVKLANLTAADAMQIEIDALG